MLNQDIKEATLVMKNKLYNAMHSLLENCQYFIIRQLSKMLFKLVYTASIISQSSRTSAG